MKKSIVILGSTGSIGCSTLQVIKSMPGMFSVAGMTAGSNIELLEKQAKEFHPRAIAVMQEDKAAILRKRLGRTIKVLSGLEGINSIATLKGADLVVAAMVGAVGLQPVLSAISAGRDIALANKETLVMAGEIVMSRASRKGVRILPVDSEHSAVFQCIGAGGQKIRRIILTASGGPFYMKTQKELSKVTVKETLNHPTWQMGDKVTVDSATLMNKGFEIIEAHHLFGVPYENIEVVIHPQSVVHSMVEFVDGSTIAQMGITDMRLPIQYALTYPQRMNSGLPNLQLLNRKLTFEAPDTKRFPCLSYARRAGEKGGTMPAALNAADEMAVRAFLDTRIGFESIADLIRTIISAHQSVRNPGLGDILSADLQVRRKVGEIMNV